MVAAVIEYDSIYVILYVILFTMPLEIVQQTLLEDDDEYREDDELDDEEEYPGGFVFSEIEEQRRLAAESQSRVLVT